MSFFQVVLYKFSDQCVLHALQILYSDSVFIINVPWIQIVMLLTVQFSPVFCHFMLVSHAHSLSLQSGNKMTCCVSGLWTLIPTLLDKKQQDDIFGTEW